MDQDDEFRFSPWDVRSLYELQVYDCPVCVFQDWSKQSFVNHAVQNHPESVQYLSNILDDSLIDVDCPWSKTNEDKKPFEESLVDNFFEIDYQDDENYPEDSAIDPDKPNIDQIKSEESDIAPTLKECFVLLEPLDPKYFGEKFLQSKTIPTIKVKPSTNDDVEESANPKEDMPIPRHTKSSEQTTEDANDKKCSYCSETFETFKLLIMHLEESHNDIVQACLSCELFFGYSRAKLEHMKSCSEKYKCWICGFECGIQNSLRVHIRGVHRKSLHTHFCDQCDRSFVSESRLKSHIEIDHDKVDMRIPCGQCEKTYRHQKHLNSHIKQVHNKGPKVVKPKKCDDCLIHYCSFQSQEHHDKNCQTLQQKICDYCQEQFDDLTKLKIHRNRFHFEKLACDICDKPFSNDKALKRHTKIFHDHIIPYIKAYPKPEPLIEMVECKICANKLTSEKTLRVHMKKYHKINVDLQPGNRTSNQTDEDSIQKKCSYCSATFETIKLLIIHLELKHNDIVYACLSHQIIFQFAKDKRSHMRTCDERYNCYICDKEVSRGQGHRGQMTLRKHIKGVHRKSLHTFACNQCDKSFTSDPILKRHVEIHHDKVDMKIPCEICGRTYRHPFLLKQHIKQKHRPNNKEKNKTWKCSACGDKVWTTRSGYRMHMRKEHEGETKKFQCHECGKEFYQSHMLEDHVKIVHENVKPYKCEQCDKAWGYKSSYDAHVEKYHATVKKFVCKICNLILGSSTSLREHIQFVHEKIAKFNCKFCGKAFVYQYNCNTHVKVVHLGIRDHKCKTCGKEFVRKSKLEKHLLEQHPNEVPTE